MPTALDKSLGLNDGIIKAHNENDNWNLVSLYTQAANRANSPDLESFFLTQAYVFALEQDHPAQPRLKSRLVVFGRE